MTTAKLDKKRKEHAEALKKAEKLAKEIKTLEKELDKQATVSLSSQEDDTPKVKKGKKEVASSDSSSDSSSESSSSSDEEESKPTKVAEKTVPVKKVVKKEEDSSDSDSSDSESSVEPTKKKKTEPTKAKTTEPEKKETKSKVAAAASSSDSSSSDSGSDSDSSSSDDEDTKMEDAPKEAKEEQSIPQKRPAPSADNGDTPNKRSGDLNKLYVRGLPWKATEHDVREFFGAGVVSLELPLDESGRSSGTAIIEFAQAAEASTIMEELNGADFQGRWLSIKIHTPFDSSRGANAPRTPSEKQPGCKTVFVGNLSFSIDEDTLRETFAQCGEIASVRFSCDRETGDFKGFGHVEFWETEATDKAIALAGTEVMGRALRVDYANDKYANDKKPGSAGRGRSGGGRGYMGGGGGGRSGGRGRSGGGGGRFSGGRGSAGRSFGAGSKKNGSIAEFKGNKITFD